VLQGWWCSACVVVLKHKKSEQDGHKFGSGEWWVFQAAGLDGQQAGGIFPAHLLMAELAPAAVRAAAVGPEPVAGLLLGGVSLEPLEVMLAVGEPALVAVGAVPSFLEGAAELCFVLALGVGVGLAVGLAVGAVKGGGPGVVGGRVAAWKVLHRYFIH